AIAPINGEDPLQTELKTVTSIRNRKKSSLSAILGGMDVQTTLLPINPEDGEKRSESSEDDRKVCSSHSSVQSRSRPKPALIVVGAQSIGIAIYFNVFIFHLFS
ncbi:hypothetical protein GCK32_022531, partial [Trichostrongylus colubriformis]